MANASKTRWGYDAPAAPASTVTTRSVHAEEMLARKQGTYTKNEQERDNWAQGVIDQSPHKETNFAEAPPAALPRVAGTLRPGELSPGGGGAHPTVADHRLHTDPGRQGATQLSLVEQPGTVPEGESHSVHRYREAPYGAYGAPEGGHHDDLVSMNCDATKSTGVSAATQGMTYSRAMHGLQNTSASSYDNRVKAFGNNESAHWNKTDTWVQKPAHQRIHEAKLKKPYDPKTDGGTLPNLNIGREGDVKQIIDAPVHQGQPVYGGGLAWIDPRAGLYSV